VSKTVLVVTILGVGTSSDPADTRVGRLLLDMDPRSSLQDDQRLSQFATTFDQEEPFTHTVLEGTWGKFEPPNIVNVTARNVLDPTRNNDDSWGALTVNFFFFLFSLLSPCFLIH
jgi:hypothetical protein